MTKLKAILIILFLTAGINKSLAQVYRFQTTGFSVMEKNEKGKWGKWSDLQNTSIIVTLDTNKNRIVIYSQEIQLYKIAAYEPVEENDNDLIYSFSCADEEGAPFTISIITRKKQGNRKQMYINQKDVIVMYNIVNYNDKP
jgi:hypothetical protein